MAWLSRWSFTQLFFDIQVGFFGDPTCRPDQKSIHSLKTSASSYWRARSASVIGPVPSHARSRSSTRSAKAPGDTEEADPKKAPTSQQPRLAASPRFGLPPNLEGLSGGARLPSGRVARARDRSYPSP